MIFTVADTNFCYYILSGFVLFTILLHYAVTKAITLNIQIQETNLSTLLLVLMRVHVAHAVQADTVNTPTHANQRIAPAELVRPVSTKETKHRPNVIRAQSGIIKTAPSIPQNLSIALPVFQVNINHSLDRIVV